MVQTRSLNVLTILEQSSEQKKNEGITLQEPPQNLTSQLCLTAGRQPSVQVPEVEQGILTSV